MTAVKVPLLLPRDATIGATEEAVRVHFKESPADRSGLLIIDMSAARFIEVATLLYIVALLEDRTSQSIPTQIRLPRQKRVRDFLRLWRFPTAVAQATSCTFVSLVDQRDHRYFGENNRGRTMSFTDRFRDESVVHLEDASFFSIQTFRPLTHSRTRLVVDESSRFGSELVKSVLGKHLDGPESYISSRIVYESMTNAARHSGASLIQTASKFVAPNELQGDSNGHFTICFWDNGRSMLDTLYEAIAEGKPVRANKTRAELYANHLLVLKDHEGGKSDQYNVSSGLVPTNATKPQEILFSTTFPGISRDPEGLEHTVHEEVSTSKPDWAGPGMGLYVLLNTAIDVFGGSVSFRTKNFFMNVKKASKRQGTHYRAKIQTFDETILPNFKGNLVTIRLPLRASGPAAEDEIQCDTISVG